jgi:hypothetical protein
MSPEKLIIQLKQKASAKAQETLDAIYNVCTEQVKHGLFDFSIANIARLGHLKGVPKAQSLRNKSGDKYRALISCFEQHHPNPLNKSTQPKKENWIDEIKNHKHKLLVRMQAQELKDAKQKIAEIIPPDTIINVHDYKTNEIEQIKLNSMERRAIEYLLSNSFKKKWYFTETSSGELLDENNKVVFKPSTMDALKKALKYL